jgi:hypothetical protein
MLCATPGVELGLVLTSKTFSAYMPTAAGRNGVGRLVPARSPDTHTREIPQALEGSDSIMPVSVSLEKK